MDNLINVKIKPLKTSVNYNIDVNEIDYQLLTEHLIKSIENSTDQDVKTEVLLGISTYLTDNFEKPFQASNIIKGGLIDKEDL